ncbi:MAG: hypothetical protein KAS16_01950 [Thermoplasmata archaeon]|nr:hypothetical protein [Thermoplasmata archaeon]
MTSAEDVGMDPIEDITSAPAPQLNDVAWHSDENIAVAVGNDSTNGYIYRYEPDNDNWVVLKSQLNDKYKSVTRVEPWVFLDDVETNIGWTLNKWSGNLNWMRVDPSTLPTPGSGKAHGPAYSGSMIWWLGNTTIGDYSDVAITKASMVSPAKHINDISTQATLSFQHWFEVENGGSWDQMKVLIRNTTGDTSWNQIAYWDSDSTPVTSWNQEAIDITGWIGNDVQLNFTFDSLDNAGNTFCGWHVDDIQLESNGVFMVVGSHGVGSYSAFTTDGYSAPVSVTNLMSFDLWDVVAGPDGTAIAVGAAGKALQWYDGIWYLLNGPGVTDTLTGIDSNDTHFFIVGYDAASQGIGYFSTFASLEQGDYTMCKIPGTVNLKLQDIAWSDNAMAGDGAGLGIIAADGNLLGLTNPEYWVKKSPMTVPPGRRNQAMSWDAEHNRLIMFGGNSGSYLRDVWAYNLGDDNWQNMNPPVGPAIREYPMMVYDSIDKVHIMFGGMGASRYGDTWAYDYNLNQWMEMTPASSPPARTEHMMVYDELNDKVILFGGKGASGNLDDTWAYDYGTNTWTNMTPGIPISPQKRFLGGMNYDSLNRRVILFGGWDSASFSDTWAYDYQANTWTNMNPASPPTGRDRFTMTFDKMVNRSVIYGGWSGGGIEDDTWTYNYGTNTWELMVTPTHPTVGYDGSIAYTDYGIIVLFGGHLLATDDETWWCRLNLDPWGEPSSNTNGEDFTAVAWDNAGTTAIAIGHDASSAVLYSYHAGNQDVSKLQDQNGVLTGHELYGVSFRPLELGAEYAMVTGASAMKIWTNAFDDKTTITVNVDSPHIFDHGLWKTLDGMYSTSKLDTQLDIDTTYTFYAEVNYTIGGIDQLQNLDAKERIEVMAWYDEGKLLGSNPEPSWLTPDNRTRQFRLTWVEGLLGTFPSSANMNSPTGSPGTDEFLLDSWWMDPSGYGADSNTRRFFFNVTLGPQTWAADGNGFGNGIGSPYYDKAQALNDPDSWDFRIRIFDNDFVNSANLSFGEFGVFRYTNITATGNPGANAPPGAVNAPLGPQSLITYSANVPYYVNASIGDLMRVGGGGSIPASSINISLQNDSGINLDLYSEINGDYWVNGKAFPGAGVSNGLCVWGNRSQATTIIPAPKNGTTAHGPWGSDFNSMGVTNINWWANVPGATAEGIYVASVTFTIEY